MDAKQVLLFALLGLGTGALIAGIALGVVLFYRGSGVINLATGGIAMLAGYSFWSLRTGTFGTHVPTAAALVITMLVVLALGVLLTLQAAMLLSFGTTSKLQPSVLPGNLVETLGVQVPVDRYILTGIVVLAALVLWVAY